MTFFTRAFSGISKLSAAILAVITATQIYSAFQHGLAGSLPYLFMFAGSILGFVAAIRLVVTAKVGIVSTTPDSARSDSAPDA
jgi:uncharacterized membrane protein YqgA involved in biofilm formation